MYDIEIMEEIDKFFEDNEKSKKRYKMLLKFPAASKYEGTNFIMPRVEKKKIVKKTVRIHRKGTNNDNIF